MSRWLFFPSTGPSLIIHDAFGGTGYVQGRTPDTVNNGNAWVTGTATGWPVTTGYAYTNTTADAAAMVDPGTTTYRVEYESKATSAKQHGFWFRFDRDAANIRSTLFLSASMSQLQFFEDIGASNVFTTLHSGLSGLTNTPIYWNVEVDGTSISYDVSTSSGSKASGTHTMVNSPAEIGIFHNANSTVLQSHDFKVYA